MPTREAIVDSILPQTVEKPIPVRTVITRPQQRPNINQASTDKSSAIADSIAPAESVKLSPQVSALAKKEQAFRQRELAFQAREKALETRLAQADRYSQLESKIKSKDFSVAEEMGLSYEEYTKYLLDKQAGEDPESDRYRALEEKIQALEQGNEEKANQEYEETVAEHKAELVNLATSDAKYALVKDFTDIDAQGKEFSGVDVALNLILSTWEEESKLLSHEDALKDTLDFLEERVAKYSALRKEPKPAVEEQKLPPPKVGSRTLTQQMQPSGIEKVAQKSLQHLSEDERYAEARRRVLARRQIG